MWYFEYGGLYMVVWYFKQSEMVFYYVFQYIIFILKQPFDLTRGCVFRARFFRQTNNDLLETLTTSSSTVPAIPIKLVQQASHDYLNRTETISSTIPNKTPTLFRRPSGPIIVEANNKLGTSVTKRPAGILHLMAHHIAIDGWSLDLLIQVLKMVMCYFEKGDVIL